MMGAMNERADESSVRRAPSAWAPLRHRVFLALFIAQMASNVGTLMQNVGSAWLMGDLHASTALVALVQTATFLPVLLVGIPAGALADIVDRRRLILTTQAWMMVFAFALAALTFADKVTPGLLLALTFALGVGTALNGPAWMAIQQDLVPKEDVPQAIALGALTYNFGRAVGPALGGLVIAVAGPPWVFMLNALSFIGVVLVVAAWRSPRRVDHVPLESLAGATRAALRYGANAPMLRGILARTVAFIFPAAALQALLPTVVREELGLGSGGYGVLLACFGAGAASGAIVRPRVAAVMSPDAMMVLASFVAAGALLVTGLVHIAWLVALTLAVAGVAWVLATITTNVAAQIALPWWVRARGLGLFLLSITGGIAIGSALWGWVAEWSLSGAYVVAAIALLVGSASTRRWKLGTADGLDLTPVPGADPVVTLMPHATDGPVIVTVAYNVPDADMVSFTEAMQVIEAHRRRTGAYQWGLFRDLGEPNRFVEIFHVESWAAHLRQHQRVTAHFDHQWETVRRYLHSIEAPAHLLSAYSHGALDPLVAHTEPDELTIAD
jgi:predicted MFS family arabinose efflux permease